MLFPREAQKGLSFPRGPGWRQRRGGSRPTRPARPPISGVLASSHKEGHGQQKGQGGAVPSPRRPEIRFQRSLQGLGSCTLSQGCEDPQSALPWSGAQEGALGVEDLRPWWARQTAFSAEQRAWGGAAPPSLRFVSRCAPCPLRVPVSSQQSPARPAPYQRVTSTEVAEEFGPGAREVSPLSLYPSVLFASPVSSLPDPGDTEDKTDAVWVGTSP